MAIDSTDLALVTARVHCCRLGAARLGFTPYDVKGPGSAYPCEYIWREVQPPTTQWTLLTEGVVCGKRPIAGFSMVGETQTPVISVTWTVLEAEAGVVPDSWDYTFTPVITGGTAPFTYSWDFGDGEAPDTNEIPIQVWARNGWDNPDNILVTLTVTDNDGNVATYSDFVTVTFNV